MEDDIYTSCIKINGVPILPPLMTEDVREEMSYYKQLAVAVEERLKYLRKTRRSRLRRQLNDSSDSTLLVEAEQSAESCNCTKENETLETELDTTQDDSMFSKVSKSSSDEDCNCTPKATVNDSPSSDAITTSTDLNQYLNESTTSTKTTTGDTSPENWKPQVPKSLNIVPITLADQTSKVREINNCQNDEINANVRDDERKMVRQGSYVLDNPSPILLAHIQTELHSSDYVPSQSSTTKRKEWNLTQIKSKWERPIKGKGQCTFGEESTPKSRPRRNSVSNVLNDKTAKFTPRGKVSLNSQRSAKSVDSIHTMTRDCESKNSSRSNTPMNGVNSRNKNISILTLADQFGGSLETMTNKTKSREKLNKSSGRDKEDDNRNIVNPVVSPEKVMMIFQEIQAMQKKQMMELLEKQQKEQMMMQEEFKRQQTLLMMQIRKAFPGSAMPFDEDRLDNQVQYDVDNNVDKCPLDYIYPLDRSIDRDGNDNFNRRMTRSLDSEAMFEREDVNFYNDQQIETMSNDNYYSDDVFSNRHYVSKRMFTFSSKTTRPTVLNHSLYNQKHHCAATVINAYVRGYLVRRLMKTERVIALKNTYKEALHCMLTLHVDAPLSLSELNFHRRLQLQLDAASSNIVDIFAKDSAEKMEIIAHDRELKKSRTERPNSARSYSFATQRTLARKKMKEMGDCYTPLSTSKSSNSIRARCQTWTSNTKDKRPVHTISQGIKRSTSAGAVRKPWR